MFRRIFAAATACALLLLAGPTMAQEPSTAPGVREHDGFFLQLQYGGGYLNLSDTQASLNGAGTGLNVLVGGSPVTNLVIFGEVFAQMAFSPTLQRGGRSYASDDSTKLTFTNIGPGLAY